MDPIRELKRVTIFKDVADPVLQIVARVAEEVSIPAGQTVVSVSDLHDALCVIRNGTVRAVPEGGDVPPLLFGAGETVGEAQFIDGEPLKGTVTALERVDLLVIRSGRLAEALADDPGAGYELYRAISRSLAGRLRRAVAMLAFAGERTHRQELPRALR
jgi:CRP-like cAMP-binding protein